MLRLVEFLVQPVAVWDDGDTLTPARRDDGRHFLAPVKINAADLAAFAERWPDELGELNTQLDESTRATDGS